MTGGAEAANLDQAVVHASRSPVYKHVVSTARRGLTLAEIASVTGVKLRAVQSWASGAARPEGETRDRLLELSYVVEELDDVYDPEGIDIWLHSRQRSLGGQRPIDLLHQGQFEDVLAAIERLAGGPRRAGGR